MALIVPTVFELSYGNQKKKNNNNLGKSGDIQQAKCYIQKEPFYNKDFVYQASELCTCKIYFLLQGPKLQNMHVTGFILLFVIKTTKHTRLYPATQYCTRI